MATLSEKLDNPVWYSLTETHQPYAIFSEDVKFYHPDYCPFGGFVDIDKTHSAIQEYANLTADFFIVGNRPNFHNGLHLNKELVCRQMVLDTPIELEEREEIIELQPAHNEELVALVNLVQPGYFRMKTSELGSYYGIFKNEQLIAVTGERMKMHAYTEVSAVVTHPDHTGKGYAKQLVAHTANKNFRDNKIPYLHVADTNVGAIGLYEKLGFITRRKISFWNLVKVGDI